MLVASGLDEAVGFSEANAFLKYSEELKKLQEVHGIIFNVIFLYLLDVYLYILKTLF